MEHSACWSSFLVVFFWSSSFGSIGSLDLYKRRPQDCKGRRYLSLWSLIVAFILGPRGGCGLDRRSIPLDLYLQNGGRPRGESENKVNLHGTTASARKITQRQVPRGKTVGGILY